MFSAPLLPKLPPATTRTWLGAGGWLLLPCPPHTTSWSLRQYLHQGQQKRERKDDESEEQNEEEEDEIEEEDEEEEDDGVQSMRENWLEPGDSGVDYTDSY